MSSPRTPMIRPFVFPPSCLITAFVSRNKLHIGEVSAIVVFIKTVHRLKVSLSLGNFLDDMYPKAQILLALVIVCFFPGFYRPAAPCCLSHTDGCRCCKTYPFFHCTNSFHHFMSSFVTGKVTGYFAILYYINSRILSIPLKRETAFPE